jgi:hypothetical protein
MALPFKPEDFRRMAELQGALTEVLARANDQKLEAAIAAFALIRCARTLLDHYQPETRAWLVNMVVVPFLGGEPFDAVTSPPPDLKAIRVVEEVANRALAPNACRCGHEHHGIRCPHCLNCQAHIVGGSKS